MKPLLKFLLGLFLGCVAVVPVHASEREVLLTLKNGRIVHSRMSEISAKGAHYSENGQTLFVPRNEIIQFTFPVAEPSVPPTPAALKAKTQQTIPSKGIATKDADLATLLASPVSDRDLPALLNRPEVRAMFATIQGQYLAEHADDPKANAAREKSNEIYQLLASGKMTPDGLRALGKSSLKQTDEYAKERQEAPQFEPLINQLSALLETP